MGTLMAWVLAQVVPPGASCQTVSVLPWTARASAVPPGPGASVAVPGGSAGSGRQAAPGPVMIWPRLPLGMIAAVPPGPNDAEVSAAPCERERRGQGPVAAVGGPGGEQAGGWPGARREQRRHAAVRSGSAGVP